jgi:hypothetical protein
MCLGSSKISAPVKQDPQDLYYNGNVFDPKPKSATTDNTSVSNNNNGNNDNKQSNTNLGSGLQITGATGKDKAAMTSNAAINTSMYT